MITGRRGVSTGRHGVSTGSRGMTTGRHGVNNGRRGVSACRRGVTSRRPIPFTAADDHGITNSAAARLTLPSGPISLQPHHHQLR